MEKINFSGGEPFLHERGDFLGKLVQFCKQDLQLPSVSIVSNGSMIKENWFRKYGESDDPRSARFKVTSNPIRRHFRSVVSLHQVTIWTYWPSLAIVLMKIPTN